MTQIRIDVHPSPAAWQQSGQALEILRQEMNRGLFVLVNQGADTAKLLAPVNVGILRSSITADVQAPDAGQLARASLYTGQQSLSYAQAVEYGSQPHWAPIKPLKTWAQQVLGDERLAYAVQWAIARRGTRAQPYFGPAVQEMRIDAPGILRDAQDRAVRRLGQAA